MDTLPRRQQEVLRATVRHYVDTVEPVGSNTLVRRFGLPASPATVRTAMGALEQRGLLTQPHTSAGRIPSQRGYRLYVDQLLPAPGAAALQLERELAGISLQWAALDDLLLHLARRLADLTGLLSLITRPQRPSPLLQAVRLVPSGDRLLVFLVQGPDFSTSLNLRLGAGLEGELPILERWCNQQLRSGGDGRIPWERLPAELRRSGGLLRQALDSHGRIRSEELDAVVAAGLGGLLAQPEFSYSSSLLPVVQLVEHGPRALLGLSGYPEAIASDAIWIGTEHPHAALGQCSVVQATYRTGHGGLGQVGLVGPMRMAYATARSAVQSVASILERLLS
ncbi:heat-inducible transcriptional repressor HrcA [Synechococcus sp. CS-1332]|uniref:HrcA family transcriptional regulator n=1 Tax=Synechococcus sp. CS-1332 TaxID=2847972 RepID=UPI00223BB718|nr:HrcA family transcriptional regulator [Synechococcus sp. CS-1332]MCT0207429.1 HrcA family transcriptional regulator [Synechococcus sp. CS-1332]